MRYLRIPLPEPRNQKRKSRNQESKGRQDFQFVSKYQRQRHNYQRHKEHRLIAVSHRHAPRNVPPQDVSAEVKNQTNHQQNTQNFEQIFWKLFGKNHHEKSQKSYGEICHKKDFCKVDFVVKDFGVNL